MARKVLVILGARLGEVRWMARLLLLNDENVWPLRDLEPGSQKETKKNMTSRRRARDTLSSHGYGRL